MKIQLIGTGSIWTAHHSASALIDGNIMIDMPGGTIKKLLSLGIGWDEVNYVILTHMHGDHVLELPVWALSKVKFKPPAVKPVIYTHQDNIEWLRQLISEPFSETLRREVTDEIFAFETEAAYDIGKLHIKRVPVHHGDMQAFGYVVEEGDRTVSFSGDTGMCEAVEMMAESSDIFVIDATRITGDDKHLGVEEVCSMARRYPDCRFITTHMCDDARLEYRKREGDNLVTGYDGMICCI